MRSTLAADVRCAKKDLAPRPLVNAPRPSVNAPRPAHVCHLASLIVAGSREKCEMSDDCDPGDSALPAAQKLTPNHTITGATAHRIQFLMFSGIKFSLHRTQFRQQGLKKKNLGIFYLPLETENLPPNLRYCQRIGPHQSQTIGPRVP